MFLLFFSYTTEDVFAKDQYYQYKRWMYNFIVLLFVKYLFKNRKLTITRDEICVASGTKTSSPMHVNNST